MENDTLPWTPDFETYGIDNKIIDARIVTTGIQLRWQDNQCSIHNNFLLRENSPDEKTVHPLSREMQISPLDIPDDLHGVNVHIDPTGCLVVDWSDNHRSRYHPGWLRDHAWLQESEKTDSKIYWNAADMPQPPTFNGPSALTDNQLLLQWLEALRDVGVSRLTGLDDSDSVLLDTVQRIGVVRETNFGRMYVLEIKDDPDSNAFTSGPLIAHMDLPTRENPPGLQFLFCRKNTTTGGQGIYVDGFKVAEDLRHEEPDMFKALTSIKWEFRNKAKTSDYRATGSILRLNDLGQVDDIRITAWLRAPLKAPAQVVDQAYRSVRQFMRRTESPEYQMIIKYQPGDLLAFDNRRALHGRRGYDAKGGQRYIEGCYADRDDLYSKIRMLRRGLLNTQCG